MKFLGLVYNGEKDELSSETREGAKLVYDKEDLVSAVNEREIENYPFKGKHSDS